MASVAGKSNRTAILCLVFVCASYLPPTDWGKNQTELFIQRVLQTRKIVFQTHQVSCFTVKSEEPRLTSRLWCIQCYICHLQMTATCSRQGKHHMSSKQYKHAHTNKHNPLWCTVYHVLRDIGFIVIPLMRQEAYNLASFGCPPPAPPPASCMFVVEGSLYYFLRLIFDILNSLLILYRT